VHTSLVVGLLGTLLAVWAFVIHAVMREPADEELEVGKGRNLTRE